MSAVWNDLGAASGGSNVLSTWLASRDGAMQRAGVQTPVQALGENATTNLTVGELAKLLGASSMSSAGVAVTPEVALRVSTVYACVSQIAGAVATLPLGIYERQGDTRSKADHEYWWLFNEQANEYQTAAAAWEYVLTAKLLYGIGYGQLLRPSVVSSRVIGWRPHHPNDVQPWRDLDGVVRYRVTWLGKQEIVEAADMLVFPGLGFDGVTAVSPIAYAARDAVGISLAAEGFSARFFAEGATFDYALKTATNLNKEQLGQLRESLLARVSGSGHQRAPLILTGGLEPAQLSINPKDAEMIAQRRFSVEEICRIFGVPPHMVGHTEKTTSWGSGIEQQSIAFVRYTLQRHLAGIAQELNRKLWPVRARYFCEHITQALERGDLKSRNEALRVAVGRAGEPGWMTTNEVRRLDNLPPVDGGDRLHQADANNTNQGAPNAQPTDPAAG